MGESDDHNTVPTCKHGSVPTSSLHIQRLDLWRMKAISLLIVGFASLISDNLPNTAARPELALPMMIGLSKVCFAVTP